MAKIETAKELAAKAKEVATKYKTLYVMGCFGAPLTAKNKKRYTNNHAYNRKPERTAMINAASEDTFGFDCVCLIKGLLWGWNGDKTKTYGGASYCTNGVPDIGADAMIRKCSEVSTDFSKLEVGEAVWTDGHIGIYIGDGLAVESTPVWKNCVQITACNQTVAGYPRRNWKKHGKLPYVKYIKETVVAPKPEAPKPEAPKPAVTTPVVYKVGDIVEFSGTVHYTTANASKPRPCLSGKAKITRIYRLGKSKHPYHLIRTGGGSTVYGWVDEGTFRKA